jgi:hypothetical protein
MTVLTPGCDPDMSVTGAPFGAAAGGGPRVRSWLVLIALVALSAFLATADAVPGLVGVPAAVVGVLCALVLVRRVLRLVRHAAARVTPGARGSGRRRPVGAAT